MSVGNVNNFNQYTTVSRNILLTHEREANESLIQLSKAATKAPTSVEIMQNTDAPMKKVTQSIKNSWVV